MNIFKCINNIFIKKKYKCEKCNKIYSNEREFKHHYYINHVIFNQTD
jgi:hypothetical protein